jgi:hypothetical protein
MTLLQITCRWCDKIIGYKDAEGQPEGVTHGICDRCNWKYFGVRPPWLPAPPRIIRPMPGPMPFGRFVLLAALIISASAAAAYYVPGWLWSWIQ